MRKLVSAAAIASLSVIAWQRLNPDQRQGVKDAVKRGRRKLANFIAPMEDLGDLTNCVDPEILDLLSIEIEEPDNTASDSGPDSSEC